MSQLRATRQRLEVAGKRFLGLPSIPGPLPELIEFPLHNWRDGASITSRWTTDITTAISGVEERWSLSDHPRRSMDVLWSGLRREATGRLFMAARRAVHQRLMVPVYPDRIRLEAAVTSGQSLLPCSPLLRRFAPGGRLVIAVVQDRWAYRAEVAEIAEVGAGGITLSEALEEDWPAGAFIAPLMATEVTERVDWRPYTDHQADFSLSVAEVIGASALRPIVPRGNYPDLPTYRQVPIWAPTMDWGAGVQGVMARRGQREGSGRGEVISRIGTRDPLAWSFEAAGRDRASSWDILRFLDSRMGARETFWVASPLRPFVHTALEESELRMRWAGSVDDLVRFLPHLMLRWVSGEVTVREVVDVRISGADEVSLTLREAIPSGLADANLLRSVTSAHLVRFASDEYTERWLTDEHLRVGLEVTEVEPERDAVMASLSDDITPLPPGSIDHLGLLAVYATGAEMPVGGEPSSTGDEVDSWGDARGGEYPPLFVPSGTPRHVHFKPPAMLRFRNDPERGLLNYESELFSNARGLTVFLVAQRRAVEGYDASGDFLLRIPDGSGGDAIRWSAAGLSMRDDRGVAVASHQVTTLDLLYPRSEPHVVALVWAPGRSARVYSNGILRGELARSPVDLPRTTEPSEWWAMANDMGDTEDAGDSAAFAAVVFRRALSIDELNGLGTYLAEEFDVPSGWSRIL